MVAITAFAMKGDEERIREGGCEAYLSKPISVAHSSKPIRTYLGELRNAMTARILVVDDIFANVRLLEAQALGRVLRGRLTADERPRRARHLRAGPVPTSSCST